jgi:hypothetical protein
MTAVQSVAQGYVLGADEGEHFAHFADAGEIFVGVGPATGSASFALGTQQVRVGGAYRSTGTCGWTKRSTFWREAEFSR